MYICIYVYVYIYIKREFVSAHKFTFLHISRYIRRVLFIVTFIHILFCSHCIQLYTIPLHSVYIFTGIMADF